MGGGFFFALREPFLLFYVLPVSDNKIQFVGHACILVTLDGHHFLIDTNFSQALLGIIRRKSPVGIDLKNLPKIAAFLVTHAHYDHLDLFSYKYFPQDIPFIVPRGFRSLIQRYLHNPVVELKPGGSFPIQSVTISASPTRHTGFRLTGLRYGNCNGYVLKGTHHAVYDPGDTAYGPHFKDIAAGHKIDVACLPIGSYRPQWFMKSRHMNPEEALQAFQDLGAKTMIPIHWGSFRLGLDSVREPLDRLQSLLQSHPMSERVRILYPGNVLDL